MIVTIVGVYAIPRIPLQGIVDVLKKLAREETRRIRHEEKKRLMKEDIPDG